MKTWSILVASLVLWAGIASSQGTNVNLTINGTSGPWLWVSGGLNFAFAYSPAGSDNAGSPAPPTIISATNGFHFTIGDTLTIQYVSGLVSYGNNGSPHVDANGDTNNPANFTTYDGGFPSNYMSPYPIYEAQLVATFANSSGQIVGTPFAIGDFGTFTIPTGATQLQLGVNDNWFGDNSGAWIVDAMENVPEPTTDVLMLMGIVGLGVMARRQRWGRRV